jgi:hypothetical protein
MRKSNPIYQRLLLCIAITLSISTVHSQPAEAGQCNCTEKAPPNSSYCWDMTYADCRAVQQGGKFFCGWVEGSCDAQFFGRMKPGSQCCKQYGKWHCPCPKT